MSKRSLGCIVLLAAMGWSGHVWAGLSTTPATIDAGGVVVAASGNVVEQVDGDSVAGDLLDEIALVGADCGRFTVVPTTPEVLPRLITNTTPLPITITFTPDARGTVSCQVRLLDLADAELGTFQIEGTGIAPVVGVPASTDFGSIRVLDTATTPTSSQVITIENASTDAGQTLDVTALGITGPDFAITAAPALPATIAPGESIEVTVQFDPSASGTRAATLDIASNDPLSPVTNAPLTGVGTAAVIGVSDVAFGIVPNATTSVVSTTVSNTAAANVGPLRVTSATISNATWFTFDAAPCAGLTTCAFANLDVLTSTTVALRCAPPADATGAQMGLVTFASDGDAGGDSVATLMCTAGRAEIAVDKPTLAFGDVLAGTSSAPQTVTVTNNGNRDLTFTATKAGTHAARYALGGSCFASCTVPPGMNETFTVTFQPDAAAQMDITINLDTNDPDPADDPFPIAVTGRGVAPAISGPASVQLGDVELGKTSTAMPLMVTNSGSSTLTITSASVFAGPADYAATGTAGAQVIAPGGMAMWSITCTPQAQGSRPGSFRILSDAANAPTLDVPLACNGRRGFLVSDPAAFDFAGVPVDSVASTSITLRNTGNLAVTGITAAVLPANVGYTVDPATVPAMLAAGGSTPVTVRFSPTATADGGPATVTFAGVWGTTPSPTAATLELTGDGLTAGFNVNPGAIAFGDLRYDTQPTRTFCITNTDETPLSIESITVIPGASTASNEFAITGIVRQTTCNTGGTPVTLPEPLAQNEILQVTVRAQPANRVGPMNAELRVASDLASDPNRSVLVTGNSTSAMLTLVPGATVELGVVDIQTAGTTAMVTLRNTGNAPLDLAGFQRTAGAAFSFTLPGDTQLAPSAELAIPVTYAPTIARAAGSEEIVTISHTIAGDIALPATGTIVLRGRGIDRDLVLGVTPVFPDTFRNPGTLGPVRLVSVTNAGEATLNVSAAMVSNDPEVWNLLDPDPVAIPGGATFDFRVRFEPKVAGPAPEARLQLVNDDVDEAPPVTTKITEVVLTGIGRDRDVAFNPMAIDLGFTELGTTITLADALIVKSLDDQQAFTIQTISFDGGDGAFAIDGAVDGIVLEPSAERRFSVSFTPQAAGPFTARAQLFLDLDPEHQAEIEVRGTAVFVDARGGGGCSTGAGAGGGAIALIALLALGGLGPGARRRRRSAAAAAVVVVALAPQALRADDNILLSVFDPTPATTSHGFQLQSPGVGAHGEWVATAVFSYASDPLLHLASEGGQHGVITSSALVELGGALALGGRFEFGARMPLYSQDGEARGDRFMEYTTDPASGTATGDLTVHGKALLLRSRLAGNGAFQLGTTVQITLPTATSGKLTGVDDPSSRLLALGSLVPGAFSNRLTLTANAGVVIRAPAEYRNLEQKSGFTWGLGASVRVADPLWVAAEVFGDLVPSGRETMQGAAVTLSPIEWLGGVRWQPDHRFTISVGAGRGLTSAAGAPALRGVLALTFAPRADKLRPIHAPPPLAPDVDSDGDGVYDREDRCPEEAEDADLFDDADGCPDLDNDGDGIPDANDRCPLEPEDMDGFQDDDGCPEKDNDGDGLADAQDKCPDQPEDKDGFQDFDGCPDLDNDGDGIPDAVDACPLEPETINGNQDDDGCPDRGDALVVLSADRIELLDLIRFQGGARLAKGSPNLLGQIGATLRAHPEILRVRVTAHVHPRDPDKDLELSTQRGQAVREWLVQWGVEPGRIDVRGFGSTKPLVPANQRGAASANDRIEFVIMEKK